MFNDDYGWLVDKDHPIKPKFDKWALFDTLVGVGAIAIGVVHIVAATFRHGAHAYAQSEFDILNETGHVRLNPDKSIDEPVVDIDPYDGFSGID